MAVKAGKRKQTQCSICKKRLTKTQQKFCSVAHRRQWLKEKGNGAGQPTVMTPEVQAAILVFLKKGFTIQRSCLLAGVSYDAHSELKKREPRYAREVEIARSNVLDTAREVVAEAITVKRDVKTSQWYLERKARNEFAARTEHTGPDGGDIPVHATGDIMMPPKLPPNYWEMSKEEIDAYMNAQQPATIKPAQSKGK